jgi:hypothetical protein
VRVIIENRPANQGCNTIDAQRHNEDHETALSEEVGESAYRDAACNTSTSGHALKTQGPKALEPPMAETAHDALLCENPICSSPSLTYKV